MYVAIVMNVTTIQVDGLKVEGSSPQRRGGRKECDYIFLLRGQKYIN
jgi:hypothetical protein